MRETPIWDRMGRLGRKVKSRYEHPIHTVEMFQARCECGWSGPVREFRIDADADRVVHWRATGSIGRREI